MIRPAKYGDVPRIVDLLKEMHAASKYAGHVGVDHKSAHDLITQCVRRHAGQHEGATLVFVVERDGQVEGFMVGMLDRIYHIGDRLTANDLYLHTTKAAPPGSARGLFRRYMKWAADNPKVYEIASSWSDAIPGAQKVGRMYQALGFEKCGEMFIKRVAGA
jgi:L-amino acid N-acyltransferase YncA